MAFWINPFEQDKSKFREPEEVVEVGFDDAQQDLEANKETPERANSHQDMEARSETRERASRGRRERRELTQQQKRIRFWSCVGVGFVLVLTGVIILAKSLSKLDETEYGLSYAKHSKALDNAARSGGLHAGPPGFEFIKFPSTFIAEQVEGTCVSQDGLLVDFEVDFQYLIKEEHLYKATIKYRNYGKWADIVEAAGVSAIHHSCAEYDIASFQHQRGAIQTTMEENLRLKLGGNPENDKDFGVYAEVVSVQLRTVDLPDVYENAVAEKQLAEEEIELANNQRKQNLTTANTELLSAQQEAQRIVETSAYDAEVLLTEAKLRANETLYQFEKEADTLESVKEALNLTTDGLLTYISTTMLEDVSSLKVTAGEPATLSRKDSL